MCEYCSLNKDFWNQIIEGAKRIRILTPEEAAEMDRRLAERAEEARDAAGEAWQAGAYPSGVTDPAETSGPRGLA